MAPPLLALLSLASACGVPAHPATGPSSSDGPGTWRAVRVPDTGVTCELPGEPRIEHQRRPARLGVPVDAAWVAYRGGGLVLELLVSSQQGGILGDPLAYAASIRDHGLGEQERQLDRTTRVELPGFHAEESEYRIANAYVLSRTVIGKERIYVAVAAFQDAAHESLARRFLASVQPSREDATVTFADGEAPAWAPMHLIAERVAVRMPTLDRDDLETVRLLGREPLQRHIAGHDADADYQIFVLDFAGDPAPTLEEFREAVGLPEGTAIHLSATPGLHVEAPGGGILRVYRRNDRIYVAEVQPRDGAATTRAADFFDSLRLVW